ncbi:MAG: hypothetical protein U9Q33_09155 [Campylobacterota bacterium]|nr:hypothetical protein [Campylobacterota bacterium]
MERRDGSIELLSRLRYIDSLDEPSLKAELLEKWAKENLTSEGIEDKGYSVVYMKELSELLYKNIIFLKDHRKNIKTQLNSNNKIKEFFK